MVLEIVLETERQEKRLMEESLRTDQVALQEKGRERSMLMRKKQRMLAKEAAKEIAQAEADRTTLIAIINPRAIPQGHPVPAKIGPADS